MSYPAGEQYEAQTQDEAEEQALDDSHPADIQGNLAAEISSEAGHPLADAGTELTTEHLQGGVDIEDEEDESNEGGRELNADSRGTGWQRQNDPLPHSFGRAEP